MINQQCNHTSADLEKEVIKRFRFLANCIPSDCKVFREPWDASTVVCLDFQACPDKFELTRKQTHLLLIATEDLKLGQSVIFRLGKKVMAWTTVSLRS